MSSETLAHILVVDDDETILINYARLLEPGASAGAAADDALDELERVLGGGARAAAPAQAMPQYRVSCARQGQDGVRESVAAVAAGDPFSVAFVDIHMPPGIDGLETAAQLWSHQPDLEIVLCTAYSDYSWQAILERVVARHQLVILRKPFDPIEVRQLAAALSEKHRRGQVLARRMEALEAQVAAEVAHRMQVELQRSQDEARISERLRRDLELQVATRTEELSDANAELGNRLLELRSAQVQLLEASRKAGMADVATSVLHNVGNVLNSVNVSAELLTQLVRQSKASGLDRALGLWAAQPDPGRFVADDPRGKTLFEYLIAVNRSLGDERHRALEELTQLSRNIDHIKVIVSMQQSLAKVGGAVDELSLHELLDDVIRTDASSHERHQVEIERDYAAPPMVTIDRHKLLQIMMNLVANAAQAVKSRPGERRITVRTRELDDDFVAIEVEDNGVGIVAENLSKIFSHGFTTKPDGHGFGLHASACAALELDGRLSAHSGGSGAGARFTVVIPRHPVRAAT